MCVCVCVSFGHTTAKHDEKTWRMRKSRRRGMKLRSDKIAFESSFKGCKDVASYYTDPFCTLFVCVRACVFCLQNYTSDGDEMCQFYTPLCARARARVKLLLNL